MQQKCFIVPKWQFFKIIVGSYNPYRAYGGTMQLLGEIKSVSQCILPSLIVSPVTHASFEVTNLRHLKEVWNM